MNTLSQWVLRNTSEIQTLVSVLSGAISSVSLIFVVLSLRAARLQTNTALEAYKEGLRPVCVCDDLRPEYNFVRAQLCLRNTGKGTAIDLCWQYQGDDKWSLFATNVLGPEASTEIFIGGIKAIEVGISIRYRSLASKEDIFTDCKFSQAGSSYNSYMLESSEAGRQRQGWLIVKPELSQPAIHPVYLAMMTRRQKLIFLIKNLRHGKTF